MTESPKHGWTPDLGTFGARLAAIRQALGWGNVAEAARACNQPVSSWRNWERDGRLPFRYRDICEQISAATGVDLEWLIGTDEQREAELQARQGNTGPLVVPLRTLGMVPPGAVDHRFVESVGGRRSRFATSAGR